MRARLSLAYALAALLVAGLPGAYAKTGRALDTPGVTPTEVLLGGTAPLSGLASGYASVARGADAYFKYVNAKGGVNGRKIVYKYLDDAYNPALTVQATKQLVEQDKVFAIFNSLGTQNNLSVRAYLNEFGVPQLFVGTGANTFGRDYKQYPWTIGYLPSYTAEGLLYGRYIAKTNPSARIAVLYETDGYGADLIAGLKRGLAGKGAIVASEGYESTTPDVQSQVASLAASKADTFMIFATPLFAIQAYVYANKLGWHPQAFVDQISSASNIMVLASEGGRNKVAKGTISIVFIKDPGSAKWAKDPGVKLYYRLMKRYVPGGDVKNVYHIYGMTVAHTMVDALKKAGRNLTREGIMNAALHLNETDNPFVLPGLVVQTTPTRRFPLGQAQLERWDGVKWVPFGLLLSTR